MIKLLKHVLTVKYNIVLFVMELENNAMDAKMDISQYQYLMEILNAKR